MSETVNTSELIDRLVQQSGMKKKLAAEILHAIPEIIEEGLMRDGEVRVKGLGTFRMKWTLSRPGRNPKTGESVLIPPHYRITFLPEQSLKDFINRDNRLLSYRVVPAGSQKSEDKSRKTEDGSQKSESGSQKTEEDILFVDKLPEAPEEVTSEVIDYKYEPEEPVRKRRVHWIIPAAIVLIAALSVVFYFRNFYQAEKTEVGSQKSEESMQPADTVPGSGFRVPGSGFQVPGSGGDLKIPTSVDALSGTQAAIIADTSPLSKNQEPGTWNPEPQLTTQNSNSRLKTQDSRLITISEGKHLFQLAREEYGNPFLWVLIYKTNQDIIKDPDQAIIGKTVMIPALEGTPKQLSQNDSLEVAEGYRLVYEFYKEKGDPRAEEFNKAYQRYLFQ